ncbi:hyoothetical protein [Trichoderma citrinoviride]|uniref:Hyoothetical protein n=1 Tax=Trichoderma citrinoviride TaxID=58853 RepID=A0A2T4BEF6_9HYPO|nr:hyoothetical protein [Trichoderma citrinoviride]PTB67579.1 hyoothetical protein [Trichoderma citrinoviride]
MPADFDQQTYWHQRFSAETSFEWLLSSTDFVAILKPLLSNLDRTSTRILNVGCGTSDLHNHFRRLGFLDVTNVDYEPLAIERGQQLERQAFGDVKTKYAVADATNPAIMNEKKKKKQKFNLVVDKSTVDAISCGGEEQVRRMARCVRECLADDDDDGGGAVWVSLSYSAARFDLEGLPFAVEVLDKVLTAKKEVTDPDIYHWCYLLRPK